MKRKIAAILASDIAGYSRLVAEDEEDTLVRFAGYRRTFEEFVSQHGGRVFNTAGDAILAEFPSAVEATRCAIDIQESMRTRNMGYAPSRQMHFRIGLTIGDVVENGDDLLGDGVNIAARLEGLAEPGGICVSRNIYEQVANKLSVPFLEIGPREVKNIPQPIHAFRIDIGGVRPTIVAATAVQVAGHSAQAARAPQITDRRSSGVGAGIVMGAVALVAGVGALGVVLWREFVRPAPPGATIEAKIPIPPASQPPGISTELQPKLPAAAQAKTPENRPNPATSTAPAGENKDPPKTSIAKSLPAKRDAEGQAEKLAQIAPVEAIAKPPAEPESGPEKAKTAPQPKTVALGPIEPPRLQQPPPTPPLAPPAPRPALPPNASPADAFAIFAKMGGIIPDAASAPELYHNARTYEARGEAANARAAYLKLAELGSDFIDPHLRFSALLRAQDGRAGARELYARLAETAGGRVAAIVNAMQFDEPERRARIVQLATQHPGYGPVHKLLADEYAPERSGGETIGEKRAQLAALSQFLGADQQGSLSQYFLDHSVLAQWLDQARTRHAILQQYLKTAKLEPTAQFMRSNAGWMVSVWTPEPATRILWRVKGKTDFKATGNAGSIDQRTGRPAPNPSFELPSDISNSTLEVSYEDAGGQPQGPFAIYFDPQSELVKGQREILQRFANSWIAFGDGGNSQYLYYTHLVSYRCAIAKVTIVFDDSPLPMNVRLPPCDPENPHAIPGNFRPYMTMPASARAVTVEVAFRDGGGVEKRKFERKK